MLYCLHIVFQVKEQTQSAKNANGVQEQSNKGVNFDRAPQTVLPEIVRNGQSQASISHQQHAECDAKGVHGQRQFVDLLAFWRNLCVYAIVTFFVIGQGVVSDTDIKQNKKGEDHHI